MENYEPFDSLISLLRRMKSLNIVFPFSLRDSVKSLTKSLQNLVDVFDYPMSVQNCDCACQTDFLISGTEINDILTVDDVSQSVPSGSVTFFSENKLINNNSENQNESNVFDKNSGEIPVHEIGLTASKIRNLRLKMGVYIPNSRKTDRMSKIYEQSDIAFPILNSFLKLQPPSTSSVKRKASDSSDGRVYAKKATFTGSNNHDFDDDSSEYSEIMDESDQSLPHMEKMPEIPAKISSEYESDLSELSESKKRTSQSKSSPTDRVIPMPGLLPLPSVPSIRSFVEGVESSPDQPPFVRKARIPYQIRSSDSEYSPELLEDRTNDVNSEEKDESLSKLTSKKSKKRKKYAHVSPAIQRMAQLEEQRQARLKKLSEQNEKITSNSTVPQLVLESDPNTGEIVAKVEEMFLSVLMPHQVDAVKFMWNVCIETVEKSKSLSSNTGCLLAHCMGLGKSLSAICFCYTLLACKKLAIDTVLVVCPAGTVLNWKDELDRWLPYGTENFPVYVFTENSKNTLKMLNEWSTEGGFCIISYDMFRCVGLDKRYKPYLCNPGPHVVLCDEAHVLKNYKTKIYKLLSGIATKIRLGMTGTPIQNCLREYYTMIKFVQPNLLDTRRHFFNNFVLPIENGQMADSTETDVRIMKRRVHVLFKILSNTVHRRGFEVLKSFLPNKVEYVLNVKLSPLQIALYDAYNRANMINSDKKSGILVNHRTLSLIWTHPFLLKERDARMCIEEANDNSELNDQTIPVPNPDWWKEHVKDTDNLFDYHHSGKMVVFLEILETCIAAGDKVLCFSNSLLTLDYIEKLLSKGASSSHRLFQRTWVKNIDYFRIDGSVSLRKRYNYIKHFEHNNRTKLFLISTKAGSLGINIVPANRVILLDVSWNPSHDLQAIFRSYRIGQFKCVYVYRLIVPKCMEEVIYGRQISKLSLSSRVIDENQIRRHFSNNELNRLFHFDPRDHQVESNNDVFEFPKDEALAAVLCSDHMDGWIISYKDHDSFLQNNIDEKLSQDECVAAWEEYHRSQLIDQFGVQPQIAHVSAALPRHSNPANVKITGPYDSVYACMRMADNDLVVPIRPTIPHNSSRYYYYSRLAEKFKNLPPHLLESFKKNFGFPPDFNFNFSPNPASGVRMPTLRLSNPQDVQRYTAPVVHKSNVDNMPKFSNEYS